MHGDNGSDLAEVPDWNIRSFRHLRDELAQWGCFGGRDVYDLNGMYYLLGACLDNLARYATEYDLRRARAALELDQLRFLERFACLASEGNPDDEEDWVDVRYAVIFGRTATGWSAHVPDLPGCIAAGTTIEEAEELIRSAIEIHRVTMREDGDTIPEPRSRAAMISVAA